MVDLETSLRHAYALGIGVGLIIVAVVLTGLSFSLNPGFISSPIYWDSTTSIAPDSAGIVELGYVPMGHLFVGRATIWSGGWGGEPSLVSLSVQDSSGNNILASTVADGSFTFTFEAPKDDYYYFFFDNTYGSLSGSSSESKEIFWQIFYYANYGLVLRVSASLLCCVGIICFVYVLRAKEPSIRREPISALSQEIVEKIIGRK